MRISLDIENKEKVIKWLNGIKRGTGDARPLWIAMTPKIIEFIKWQFRDSDDAAKRWKKLTPKYKSFKERKGFPTAIGVMTGRLRSGAGENAKKKYKRKSFIWRLNERFVRNEKGTQYGKYFNAERPVYDNVAKRVNSFLSTDIKKFESGSQNSFTYKWLRNALRGKI